MFTKYSNAKDEARTKKFRGKTSGRRAEFAIPAKSPKPNRMANRRTGVPPNRRSRANLVFLEVIFFCYEKK